MLLTSGRRYRRIAWLRRSREPAAPTSARCLVFESLDPWSGWRDSNPRPLRPERSALPSCATPRVKPRQRIAPTGRFAKADGIRDNGLGRRCCVDHIRLGPGIYVTDRRGITGMSATLNRLNTRRSVQGKRENHDGVRRRGVRRIPGSWSALAAGDRTG
jgi:hypothetical protein